MQPPLEPPGAPRLPARALGRLLLALALALAACAKQSPESAYPGDYDGGWNDAAPAADAPAGAMYDDKAYEAEESRAAPASAPMPQARGAAGGVAANQAPPPPEPEKPAPAEARMIHYSAQLTLSVNDAEATLGRAAAAAAGMGGFVESLAEELIVVRVPVARFEEALQALAALGEVTDKRLSARDVTDAWADAELRLRSDKAARERLLELLAKAQSEGEKIALLREIQRLSLSIEELEQRTKILQDLAAFSRITVRAQRRVPPGSGGAGADELAAFWWIGQLSPFDHEPPPGRRLELAVPEGMVVLPGGGPWIAEGPDGTVLWATRLRMAAEGDTAFWQDAVERRLKEGFDDVSTLTAGGFALVRLEDRSDRPFTWLVGVRCDGRTLDVVHLYLPNPAAEARFKDAVLKALESGGGAS